MMYGRLPWLTPEEMTHEQRELYDKIASSPRAANRPTPLLDDHGRLYGPFNALLANPGVGDAVQAVGTSLRFSGTLPRPLFELLVLMVAKERGASYEWYAHEPIARSRGVADEQIDAIRQGRDPHLVEDSDDAVVKLARACLQHEEPSESLVRRVEATYSSGGVTEVVVVVGFYDLMATLMRTWTSPLPSGAPDPLSPTGHER